MSSGRQALFVFRVYRGQLSQLQQNQVDVVQSAPITQPNLPWSSSHMAYQSYGQNANQVHGKRQQCQLQSCRCSTRSQTLAFHMHHTCCEGKKASKQCLNAEHHLQP